MSAVIFSGNTVKSLKPALALFNQATIYSGNVDPSSTSTTGNAGDLYISTLTNKTYQKLDSGSSTNWTQFSESSYVSGPGDINPTSYTAADNTSTPTNITGFSFANASVRGFEAQVSIVRGSTYAEYELSGIQKGSSWELGQTYTGDSTGIIFSITSSGALQFTSTSTGNSATLKFRATTT